MENIRHRGRPRKIETDIQETIMAEEYLPKVHVIMRYLSNMNISNPATGEVSGAEMDAILSDWVVKGYKIVYATSAGQNPNGHGLIVFLQRD
jgi:hypothetical protein